MGLVYRQISLLAQLYKTCIGECNRSHPTEQHCWQKQQRCTDDKKKLFSAKTELLYPNWQMQHSAYEVAAHLCKQYCVLLILIRQ